MFLQVQSWSITPYFAKIKNASGRNLEPPYIYMVRYFSTGMILQNVEKRLKLIVSQVKVWLYAYLRKKL